MCENNENCNSQERNFTLVKMLVVSKWNVNGSLPLLVFLRSDPCQSRTTNCLKILYKYEFSFATHGQNLACVLFTKIRKNIDGLRNEFLNNFLNENI